LASIFGAHAILLAVISTIFTIAAASGASELPAMQDRMRRAELRRKQQREELARRQQPVKPQRHVELEWDCFNLSRRAGKAEETILASVARAENLLDQPIDEKLLRENVLAVLNRGIRITDLRAKQRAITGEKKPSGSMQHVGYSFGDLYIEATLWSKAGEEIQPGPQTAAVLEPQKQALAMMLRSMTSRVENLERYASSIKAVDATYRDWIGAQQAERLNQVFRDELAETMRDKLAAEELKTLSERAAMAEQAFHDSIDEANLAAEILALPADGGS
jgi:hypothetical protein